MGTDAATRPATGARKRIALTIGNAAYESAPALENATADAHGIADKLAAIGFTSVSRLDNLNCEATRRALQQFGRDADDAEIAIIYYAGHAIEVDGENYLIPVDAKLERDRDVSFETVSLTQVLTAIDGPGALRLMILDACRDNPFRSRIERSSGRTRALGRGLADVEPSGNKLVIFSAKGGTVALDGDGPHSPFAHALMDLLPTPGLEFGFLFRQVRDAVLKATGRRQEPYLYGSLGADHIFLVPEAVEAKTADAAPPAAIDIFISYAATDRARIAGLAKELETAGYRVWWDTKLLGGDEYRRAIQEKLTAARAAVVLWTPASIDSSWVYDEADRARKAKKLIPMRVAELEPDNIPPPFGAFQTLLFDDRASLTSALAARNVLPAAPAAAAAPAGPAPVDAQTLEHSYWTAIEGNTDPSDFETFVEKFPGGLYAPVARKRIEQIVASAVARPVLERFLREYPNSQRAPLARARMIVLEWSEIESLGDAGKLRAFIARYGDSPFVDRAKAELARVEWKRLSAGEDASEIERAFADLAGTSEAKLAAERVAALRRPAPQPAPQSAPPPQPQPAAAPAPTATTVAPARTGWSPYLMMTVAGIALGFVGRLVAFAGMFGLRAGQVSLLSVSRAVYIAWMIAAVWKLAGKPGILRVAGLFAALYAMETAVGFMESSGPVFIAWSSVMMVIEWLVVAAFLAKLDDAGMLVIAAVMGAVFGVLVAFVFPLIPYPAGSYVSGMVAYPMTALCLIIGFLRQKPELRKTNWFWGS